MLGSQGRGQWHRHITRTARSAPYWVVLCNTGSVRSMELCCGTMRSARPTGPLAELQSNGRAGHGLFRLLSARNIFGGFSQLPLVGAVIRRQGTSRSILCCSVRAGCNVPLCLVGPDRGVPALICMQATAHATGPCSVCPPGFYILIALSEIQSTNAAYENSGATAPAFL